MTKQELYGRLRKYDKKSEIKIWVTEGENYSEREFHPQDIMISHYDGRDTIIFSPRWGEEMKIYNVIEKDQSEVFVYSFSSYEKAKAYYDECFKHFLRMHDLVDEEELINNFSDSEDWLVINEDSLDVYVLDYELYIEEKTLNKGFDFNSYE